MIREAGFNYDPFNAKLKQTQLKQALVKRQLNTERILF